MTEKIEVKFPQANSGALREKLNSTSYDLIPFHELAEAYMEVSEYGANKYKRQWESECQGLLNVRGVERIRFILPEIYVRLAITEVKERKAEELTKEYLKKVFAHLVISTKKSKLKEQESAVVVTIRDLNKETQSIEIGRGRIKGTGIKKTKNMLRMKNQSAESVELLTQFCVSVINELNFSQSSKDLTLQNQNTLPILQKDVQFACPRSTCISTMTMKLENLEEFCVQSATTDSDFWGTILRELRERCVISRNETLLEFTGCWNWSLGLSRIQIISSLLRHTWAYLRGEDRDKESGLLHTSHCLWNAVTLVHNVHHNLEDGRRVEPYREYKNKDNK